MLMMHAESLAGLGWRRFLQRRGGVARRAAPGRARRSRPGTVADRRHRRPERLRAASGAATRARRRGRRGLRRRRTRCSSPPGSLGAGALSRPARICSPRSASPGRRSCWPTARWPPGALPPGRALAADASGVRAGLAATVATCLALTWLNPHVYLDTVVLLGSLPATHAGYRWWFAAWCGRGQRRLVRRPGLRRAPAAPGVRPAGRLAGARRVIAVVMTALGVSLAVRAHPQPDPLGEVELPGDAEAVVEPAEAATEPVFAEWHELRPAVGQRREDSLDLVLGLALDLDGERRREREIVRHEAVAAEELLSAEGNARAAPSPPVPVPRRRTG